MASVTTAALLLSYYGGHATTLLIPAGPYSLRSAQTLARREILTRKLALQANSDAFVDDVQISLGDGIHREAGGLHLSDLDSGVDGVFRVTWSATNNSIIDGGRTLSGGFTQDTRFRVGVYSIAAPAILTDLSKPLATRQLFYRGIRLNRTAVNATTLGLDLNTPWNSAITDNGYKTVSTAALKWLDPSSIELISDHTWVQHRCILASITKLPVPPSSSSSSSPCTWGPIEDGASPGSSLPGPKLLNVPNVSSCQAHCCQAQSSGCQGIIFHALKSPSNLTNCYLLNRDYKPNFIPQGNSFCAALNGPPPPAFSTRINVSSECWETARVSGYGQLTYPSRFENVPVFGSNHKQRGEWWLDRVGKRIVVSLPESAATPSGPPLASDFVWSKDSNLLQLHDGAHDISFINLTFAHSTWNQPNTNAGFVERYGNVYFAPQRTRLVSPHAAVMVANAARISFTHCTFEKLGAWGLRIYNGSTFVSVTRSSFRDLSGGAIMIGNVNDTNGETRPASQTITGHITIEDNVVNRVGVEYAGAPAIHSFCTHSSSISHNTIRDVSYTGLSYNWPNPQGPTLAPTSAPWPAGKLGYSKDNRVEFNDVSLFDRYMTDGGGIHTIGRSINTSVRGNFFHGAGSGMAGEHSVDSTSIVYIDNFSQDFTIADNVVDNCPHTKLGMFFFQGGNNGNANRDHMSGLWSRGSGENGTVRGGPNITVKGFVVVPSGSAFPAEAQAIIEAAGQRE